MQRYSHFARGSLILLLLAGLFAGLVGPRMVGVGAAPQVAQAPAMSVIINEIAWSGTQANANAEWIELYNPGAVDVNLTGWSLQAIDGTPNITLSGTIVAGGYYLLERTADTTVSDIAADLIYTGALSNTVEVLELRDNTNTIVDTANQGGTAWYAGDVANSYSMERTGVVADGPTAWVTNVGIVRNGLDANGNPINGTPRQQNWAATVTATPSPTNTATPTITSTATVTSTITATGTITPTRTPTLPASSASALDVLINEVAWMGTSAQRSNDEWIELYNTHPTAVNLDGWKLTIEDSTNPETDLANFGPGDTLPASGFFLLARVASGGCTGTPDINIFTDIVEDKCFSASLSNAGEILRLYDSFGTLIDTANSDGGGWPAGSSSSYSSMERRAKIFDTFNAWVTYGGSTSVQFAHNRDGILVRGSPKRANWFTTITATPTRTRTKKPTPRPPTPVGRPIINEFLPRPGFDWNHDGAINTYDEFIEVMNIGPVNINIGGWRLDNGGDGGNSFTLPSLTLAPGQRVVYYASETNVHLSDGGSTVRLISSNGTIMDAYTYGIAKVVDQSWCRLPEGRDWYKDCVPTPALPNTRQGQVPSMPPTGGLQEPICRFADTLPRDVLFAECNSYGANMWNSTYWDKDAGQGDRLVPDDQSKWVSFVE